MSMKKYYERGGVVIYNARAEDVVPGLEAVDLLLTDPPYGGVEWGKGKAWQGSCGKGRMWDGKPSWDVAPTGDFLCRLITMARAAILWGGNYFEGLPPQKAWLVWDKCADMTQAQAELAWTNLDTTVRIFRQSPLGIFGNSGRNFEFKEHPTQKPTPLMEWCLRFVPEAVTVFDPYCGSGTTLVAAAMRGLEATGVELSEAYCEIAARRLDTFFNQPDLFTPPVEAKPVQLAMEAL